MSVIQRAGEIAPQVVCPGETVSFEVAASGTALSYQWFKDGVVLEGQTQSIPLIMKFDDVIKFEIHTTQSFDVDLSLEAIYQREV